ncbi:multidrug efflux SMR transporter [Paenibacillus timonensis]|jgi:paired small multidrug resistance pump|uniref:DMT family transporter n=1 Tax=Paenibacillus timonensis TaxID=225915 RepID=A0ABW3SJM1_9BACL|nr:multidrug efflux SMR transporter [Paenibacillus timonensis]MCH1643103.1 multidrug efflux SMR transporter [Paenibacillus timonensis]GJM83876.1 multidrug resistance protein YkkC [Paenibacillus sp. HMSSN-139]
MKRDWGFVGVAGLFEIGWVIGLKHAGDVPSWGGTVVCIVMSMYLLILSGRRLPIGTVYAVFTGIGTAGTVIAEMALFGEPFRWTKLLLIMLLLVGVIGLKLVTDGETRTEGEA